MSKLTHLDAAGRAAMVDVGTKPETVRTAVAQGRVLMSAAALALVSDGGAPKGDVLAAARIAGIMAAKKTAELIPLCHPLALTKIKVELVCDPAASAIEITATAGLTGRTGVEMEALTAVTVAALTIYDMLKSTDKHMKISDIRLTFKDGGKSGHFEAE